MEAPHPYPRHLIGTCRTLGGLPPPFVMVLERFDNDLTRVNSEVVVDFQLTFFFSYITFLYSFYQTWILSFQSILDLVFILLIGNYFVLNFFFFNCIPHIWFFFNLVLIILISFYFILNFFYFFFNFIHQYFILFYFCFNYIFTLVLLIYICFAFFFCFFFYCHPLIFSILRIWFHYFFHVCLLWSNPNIIDRVVVFKD